LARQLRDLDKTPQRRYQTANELAQAYMTALTLPYQVEKEEVLPSYNTVSMDVAGLSAHEKHVSIQGERLVLRSNPLDIPAKIPSQRSTRASQAAPVETPRAAAGVHLQVQTPARRRRVRYRRRNRVLISMMVVLIMLLLVIVAVLILTVLARG
jgi:hypothetical protein